MPSAPESFIQAFYLCPVQLCDESRAVAFWRSEDPTSWYDNDILTSLKMPLAEES